MALSCKEIEYAARCFFDEAKPLSVIVGEISIKFGTSTTESAIRSRLWRSYPDKMRANADSKSGALDAFREEIRADALAGMAISEIARKHGVSVQYVSLVAPIRKITTISLGMRRRLGALLDWGPMWVYRHPIKPKLEGEVTAAGKLFADLGQDECRYPIGRGEDGSYRFCGCPRLKEASSLRRPYCRAHGRVAVLPNVPQVVEPGAPLSRFTKRLPALDARYADEYLRAPPARQDLPAPADRALPEAA